MFTFAAGITMRFAGITYALQKIPGETSEAFYFYIQEVNLYGMQRCCKIQVKGLFVTNVPAVIAGFDPWVALSRERSIYILSPCNAASVQVAGSECPLGHPGTVPHLSLKCLLQTWARFGPVYQYSVQTAAGCRVQKHV